MADPEQPKIEIVPDNQDLEAVYTSDSPVSQSDEASQQVRAAAQRNPMEMVQFWRERFAAMAVKEERFQDGPADSMAASRALLRASIRRRHIPRSPRYDDDGWNDV